MADDAVLKKLISGAAEKVLDLVRNLDELQHAMLMLDPDEVIRAVSMPSDLVEEIGRNCEDDEMVNEYLRDGYASILRVHRATSYAIVSPAYFEDPASGSSDLVVLMGAYTGRSGMTGYFPIRMVNGNQIVDPFIPDPPGSGPVPRRD